MLRVELGFCTPRHTERIYQLESLCFPDPWHKGLIRGDLESRGSGAMYIGAWWKEQLVGYAACRIERAALHILRMAVDPSYRGRMIGGQLLVAQSGIGELAGCRYAALEVRPSNSAALRLYKQFGFAPAGKRVGYYKQDGEDALVLRALLPLPSTPPEGEEEES